MSPLLLLVEELGNMAVAAHVEGHVDRRHRPPLQDGIGRQRAIVNLKKDGSVCSLRGLKGQ
jgi:hypothetical protein